MNDEQYARAAAEYERIREELANPGEQREMKDEDRDVDNYMEQLAEEQTEHIGGSTKES